MLFKNFYTILKWESLAMDSIQATVEIQKDHRIFEGHFPNFPVTPGIALLQIMKELTEIHCEQSLFLEAASNVKFLTLVDPNVHAHLKFRMTFQEEGDVIKVKNTTSFEDGTSVLKCNVNFAKR